MFSLYLAIWALIGLIFQTPESVGKPPFRVCEVLGNIEKFEGKVIEVRGEWAVGYALLADCPVPLKTGDQTWINGIALETPESVNRDINTLSDTTERPAWNLDQDALTRAYDIESRLASSKGPNTKVFATFVGRLDVTPQLLGKGESLQTPERPERFGFGHLNAYPARLVLITVRGVGLSMQDSR